MIKKREETSAADGWTGSTAPAARRALIIGGSMGGLFAALYLRQRGWRVDVFERLPVPLTGRGAGITTHAAMLRAIADVAGSVPADFGVAFQKRETLDGDGAVIGRLRRQQIATSWNRLYEILRRALPDACYRLGMDFVRYEDDGRGVTAIFVGGARERGDVLIGGDGFRSFVRAQFQPDAQPEYAGYVAWRGLIDERALSARLHAAIFEKFMFHLPPGEQVIGYPVAGNDNDLRPGHRSWNMLWYRPADEATELPRLLMDDTGTQHQVSIPPPLISRHVIAELRADAERLPPQLREAFRCVAQPFLQPIYDLDPPRMVTGRVGLVGDAAFVARPHLGGGVVKAAQDSAAMARHLSQADDIPAALLAYEAERQPRCRIFVAHGRRLGSYIRKSFDNEQQRQAAEKYREPRSLMIETALMDALIRAGAVD